MARKRRAPVDDQNEDYDSAIEQTQRSGRRRGTPDEDGDAYGDGGASTQNTAELQEQLAKKMVRMALACEYARIPIRRTDISSKVLDPYPRQFKAVFEMAQEQLRNVFGMVMVELPQKDRVTIQQRRAVQRQEKQSTSSNAWVLTSLLPEKLKVPEIIPPPRVPTTVTESTYVGLYTFIVSCIMLAGGTLPEAKLDRYLRRVNADQSTPIDKTEKLLQRMIREQYIVRVKDSSNGEEDVDYMVGPRGKVEIGQQGAAELVKTVYGAGAPNDLEKRLERSLGLNERSAPSNGAPDG